MESQSKLPPELQELYAAGILRQVSENEFTIDGLDHRERSGYGRHGEASDDRDRDPCSRRSGRVSRGRRHVGSPFSWDEWSERHVHSVAPTPPAVWETHAPVCKGTSAPSTLASA